MSTEYYDGDLAAVRVDAHSLNRALRRVLEHQLIRTEHPEPDFVLVAFDSGDHRLSLVPGSSDGRVEHAAYVVAAAGQFFVLPVMDVIDAQFEEGE